MFTINLGSRSKSVSLFNETAFDNSLKVRNSSLKTDYISNALWEKVVSSPLRAAVAKLITSPQ